MPIDMIQKAVTTTYVRFKVTTCLNFCPSDRPSSLSTLIAVTVNRETKVKMFAVRNRTETTA